MPPHNNFEEIEKPPNTLFTVSPVTESKGVTYNFEDALDKTGFGKFTWLLFFLCTFSIVATVQEVFGTSYLVTASACELNLDTATKGIVSGVPMAGIVVSAHFWGYVADTRGRKTTLLLSMGGSAICSFIGSWSMDWIMFAIFKFLSAAFSSATNAVAYTLFSECCPKLQRSKMVLLMSSGLMGSNAFMSVVAYPILTFAKDYYIDFLGFNYKPWRLLYLTYSMLIAIFTILVYFFTWESPKFYLSEGREEECLIILRKIHRANNGKDDDFNVDHVILTEQVGKLDRKQNIFVSMWNQTVPLYRGKMLKNTLIITYVVMVVSGIGPGFAMWFPHITNAYFNKMNEGIYSGPTICDIFSVLTKQVTGQSNTTVPITPAECDSSIDEKAFLFVFVFSSALVLLNVMNSFLVKRFSKKYIIIAYHIVSGVAGLSLNYIGLLPVSLVFLAIMCFGAVCMGICTSIAVEMYPTYCRGMAVCLTMMVGRGASIITIKFLGTFLENSCVVTFYGFGFIILSAAAIGFLLPSEKELLKNSNS